MTDLGLDHIHSVHPQPPQTLMHTEAALHLHLLHDNIQQNQCPCSTHTCTAVDQEGLLVRDRVHFTDMTDEGNERHDVIRHSMIRPGCVV